MQSSRPSAASAPAAQALLVDDLLTAFKALDAATLHTHFVSFLRVMTVCVMTDQLHERVPVIDLLLCVSMNFGA